MEDRLQVVYVMGAGRSGSTVLNALLGSHPAVLAGGELSFLPSSGWRDDDYCACGEPASRCAFWSRVRSRWEAEGGDLERYLGLQRRFERRRHLPLLALRGTAASGAFGTWADQTRSLLRAIRDESGATALVDSSKAPVRALALSKVPGVELFALHLVRDGRGVAWSLAKRIARDERAGRRAHIRPRSVVRSALFWRLTNAQANWVRARLGPDRSALVRYEDYAESPAAGLAPVARFLGEDFSEVAERVGRGDSFDLGHTIAGNRVRMSGPLRLRMDVEWRDRMAPRDRRLFWRLAAPQMRRFGYSP